MARKNRYTQIIERIFAQVYTPGAQRLDFEREDIEHAASELHIKLPKNLGDLIYAFRYREELPESVASKAPPGKQWVIFPAGRGRYRFEATALSIVTPREGLLQTKIPDATPGIIARYALSDEQALLARLRYNRLIDIFSGVACYSLQSHLRTTVSGMGQVETDEIYVGVDKKGSHYVLPVQAKGGKDSINIVQIIQDLSLCRERFVSLICRPIGAQFLRDNAIAMFEFQESPEGFGIVAEKHYRLVPQEELTEADLESYRSLSE